MEEYVEVLDDETINRVSSRVDTSWPELALYLGVDIQDCQSIMASFPGPTEQAGQMLAKWRTTFNRANPLETLSKALAAMDDPALCTVLGALHRIPSCPTCGNSDPVKFRRYFSLDGQSRLVGISCTACGRELLQQEIILPHPERKRMLRAGVVANKQRKPATPAEEHAHVNPAFQVKRSRTNVDLDHALDVLKVGDHIGWQRPYVLWHHAIVSAVDKGEGVIKVIHWNKIKGGCGTPQVMEQEIRLGDQSGGLYCFEYEEGETKANPPELVLARARSRVGDTGYQLLGENCEALASYCKTGVAESYQVCWLYNKVKTVVNETLLNTVMSAVEGACVIAKEYVKAGSENFLQKVSMEEGVKLGTTEAFEKIAEGTKLVEAGIVIVIEGVACIWDLGEYYKSRKQGDLLMEEFIATVTKRVTEAVIGADLAVGLSQGGQAAGAAAGTFIIPGPGTAIGGFIGSILGGVVGSLVGRAFGSFIGPYIGRTFARAIGTDDRAVRIEELQPGDQVVSYGNLLHPRHHAIVVSCAPGKNKVKVVHSTYSKGVVEEDVDFIDPMYQVIYDEENCFPPEEVIDRARSKIVVDAYTYSLVWNNCKHFAQWCKLKQ